MYDHTGNMECMIIPVTSGVTRVVRKELKKKYKPLQENTQQFHRKHSAVPPQTLSSSTTNTQQFHHKHSAFSPQTLSSSTTNTQQFHHKHSAVPPQTLRIFTTNTQQFHHKHSAVPPQTTATLGTLHIIGKVLQPETGNLSSGDRCWCGRRSAREKRRVTMNDRVIIIIIIIIEMFGPFCLSVCKGRYRGSKGCQDQILISKAMLQECSSRKKMIRPLLLDFTQRRMVILYRRFETTSRVRFKGQTDLCLLDP
jgi:hypothetical protein